MSPTSAQLGDARVSPPSARRWSVIATGLAASPGGAVPERHERKMLVRPPAPLDPDGQRADEGPDLLIQVRCRPVEAIPGGGMAGRLPVRSLVRLVLLAALAAGLCTTGRAPALVASAAVVAVPDSSPPLGVMTPAGWLTAGSKAANLAGRGGQAIYSATPGRDLRGAPQPWATATFLAAWQLALHVAWAPWRPEHGSGRMARVGGSSPGRGPPVAAGF
jgi:hypothetical protein